MALNRWVTYVTPASTAAVAWAAVDELCPAATTTPRSTSVRTSPRAPGNSGARVTRATAASRHQPSPSITSNDGAMMCRGS